MAAGRALINRVYRSEAVIVNRTDLVGPSAIDHIGDIVFRLATADDFDRLGELERYGRGSIHRTRVEKDKDWLFVACHGDRIVATVRYGRVVRDRLASRVVQLGPTQVWAADAFCLPEYRNQGISRHLLLFVWRFLASRGYTELFGAIRVTNTRSLRVFLHAGSKPLYYVSSVRILLWEHLRVSKDIPRKFSEGLK
jgi:GNAT superfamily N-acetyltransferase